MTPSEDRLSPAVDVAVALGHLLLAAAAVLLALGDFDQVLPAVAALGSAGAVIAAAGLVARARSRAFPGENRS